MKVYNVLFESDYENEDVHSEISTFSKREDAVRCLENTLKEEIGEGCYTEDELKRWLVRDGDDFFCIYHDDAHSNWKFRCTIYETELY